MTLPNDQCRHGLDPSWCDWCKRPQAAPVRDRSRVSASSKVSAVGRPEDREPRRNRLIRRIEAATTQRARRVAGGHAQFQFDSGLTVLTVYAAGHPRANGITTFFVGVPRCTPRSALIALACGDSDQDVFVPYQRIAEHARYLSHDRRDWKPYIFRAQRGNLVLRIAAIKVDIALDRYEDPSVALRELRLESSA
jgi:hypothetical protein